MLKVRENETLTRVGRGTPAGEWLRRYWHPIAISEKWDGIKTLWKCNEQFMFKGRMGTVVEFGKELGTFTGKPTAVRVLGEDLVLFRDGGGRLGLFGLRCPHRGASFEYGRVRQDGLECCYHGWRFDVEGRCLEQPAEPAGSGFKDKVRHLACPVREMGGLIWAYLGSGEAPILPKIDVVAREDGIRAVENWGVWPANYLQIIENSVDQVHTGILHGAGSGERRDVYGLGIPDVSWEEDDYGIISTQKRGNYVRVSHFVMPTINILAEPWPAGFRWPRLGAHFRTPVDDSHTLFFSVTFTPYINGEAPELPEGVTFDKTDQLHHHRLQDYHAIVSQGKIFDRTAERLGTSDRGVALLRKMLMKEIQVVQRGKDPRGVRRTGDENVIVDFGQIVVDSLMYTAA